MCVDVFIIKPNYSQAVFQAANLFLAREVLSEANSLDWSVHKTHKCTVRKRRVGTVIVQKAVFGICRMKYFYLIFFYTKKKIRF